MATGWNDRIRTLITALLASVVLFSSSITALAAERETGTTIAVASRMSQASQAGLEDQLRMITTEESYAAFLRIANDDISSWQRGMPSHEEALRLFEMAITDHQLGNIIPSWDEPGNKLTLHNLLWFERWHRRAYEQLPMEHRQPLPTIEEGQAEIRTFRTAEGRPSFEGLSEGWLAEEGASPPADVSEAFSSEWQERQQSELEGVLEWWKQLSEDLLIMEEFTNPPSTGEPTRFEIGGALEAAIFGIRNTLSVLMWIYDPPAEE